MHLTHWVFTLILNNLDFLLWLPFGLLMEIFIFVFEVYLRLWPCLLGILSENLKVLRVFPSFSLDLHPIIIISVDVWVAGICEGLVWGIHGGGSRILTYNFSFSHYLLYFCFLEYFWKLGQGSFRSWKIKINFHNFLKLCISLFDFQDKILYMIYHLLPWVVLEIIHQPVKLMH